MKFFSFADILDEFFSLCFWIVFRSYSNLENQIYRTGNNTRAYTFFSTHFSLVVLICWCIGKVRLAHKLLKSQKQFEPGELVDFETTTNYNDC